MASEETSLNTPREQETSSSSPSNEQNTTHDDDKTDKARLQSMVTPEQVLSASVARKRRNVTKKRSQSSGGKLPRDKTPIREIPANNNNDHDDDNNETNKNQQINSKQTDTETTTTTSPPSRPERRRSREIKQNELVLPKPADEQPPPPDEVQKLLNTAKRSLSSRSAERQSRKTTGEKKAIIKRSKSAPREFSIDDADLIESFKKAQQLSIEVGTANLKVNYTASDEDSIQTSSVTSDEDKSNLIKEKTPLKNKEQLIKHEDTQEKPNKPQVIEQYSTESTTSDEEKYKSEEDIAREKAELKQKLKLIKKVQQENKKRDTAKEKEKLNKKLLKNFIQEVWLDWKQFLIDNIGEYKTICTLRNRCISHIIFLLIFCGIGGFIFRFTEGAFETFYKCGVKRVKRDFIDSLWLSSHNLREDDWKSLARRKLMEFEDQLHEAHEAGVHSYSGQRSWTFLNAVIYCLTVVTTIGNVTRTKFK